MIEFNPDGSLKLPENVAQRKQEKDMMLRSRRCMKIEKDLVSTTAPKRCILHLKLSDAINDDRFIETLFNEWRNGASVPGKLSKVDERQFDIEIGTDFRRCTDCSRLIGEYRDFLDGNIIEEKGQCTFEGFKRSFSYEDHFD